MNLRYQRRSSKVIDVRNKVSATVTWTWPFVYESAITAALPTLQNALDWLIAQWPVQSVDVTLRTYVGLLNFGGSVTLEVEVLLIGDRNGSLRSLAIEAIGDIFHTYVTSPSDAEVFPQQPSNGIPSGLAFGFADGGPLDLPTNSFTSGNTPLQSFITNQSEVPYTQSPSTNAKTWLVLGGAFLLLVLLWE